MGLQAGRLTLPLTEEVDSAIAGFDCSSAERDDPVAENVCDFLRGHRFTPGIEHNFSATYLLIDRDLDPSLIGYVTLTLDAVRLTNAEKNIFGERPDTGGFGAARIQMIGVDSRHQGAGYGYKLVQLATALARDQSWIPPRFLLADANIRQLDWYERQGFVANRAEREVVSGERAQRVVSMRLDLQDPKIESIDDLSQILAHVEAD